MLFSLDGYEKFSPKYPRLFTRPGEIVVLKVAPFTSEETLIVGIFVGVLMLIFLAVPFIPQLLGEDTPNFIQARIPFLVVLGCCIVTALASKQGMDERKERGGIHPKDTIYLFSKDRQEIKEQKGESEMRIGTLQEATWSVKIHHAKNHTNYKPQAQIQNKKITLATSTRKSEAEELLEKIKSVLGIT